MAQEEAITEIYKPKLCLYIKALLVKRVSILRFDASLSQPGVFSSIDPVL